MRRFALVTLVSSTLIACGPAAPAPAPPAKAPAERPAPPPAPPPPPAPEPAKPSLAELQRNALQTTLKALNAHDPKAFASVYADDAVISVAGLNDLAGRDAIAANMAEWFETFKDVRLGFSRVWIDRETMVLEWVINGKHHGELFGVKGKEEPIGHYGLSVVTFDANGKVTRENRYGELGAVMTQIGGKDAKTRPIPPVPEKPEVFTLQPPREGEANHAPPQTYATFLLHTLEKKEEKAFLSGLSPEVQSDGLFHLQTAKGKDEAKRFFKSFTTAFPDAKFDISRILEVGDYAIVESVLRATQKGPLGAIKPTGRPVAIHLADVVHVKDGAVDRISTFQNSLELQQQLGLFAIPAAGTVPASQAPAPKK